MSGETFVIGIVDRIVDRTVPVSYAVAVNGYSGWFENPFPAVRVDSIKG